MKLSSRFLSKFPSKKPGVTVVQVLFAFTMTASVWARPANTGSHWGDAARAMLPLLQAAALPTSQLISPEELVKNLQSPKGEKPLMIQVGSHVLYQEAHIPGSEYIGPASREIGILQLRKRVEALPRGKFIVIYCGCCPWNHCPNVKPADDALRALGFTNVKVLYIPDNFGTNWVDKGYPVAKGE